MPGTEFSWIPVSDTALLQATARARSSSRSEAIGVSTSQLSSMAAQRQARGSIRELYADWCAAVRMHAHASALSTAPASMAQRAAVAASSSGGTSDITSAPAFKGPRPVLQPVTGEPDVMTVSAGGADRLWLDQQKLTRCCIVTVLDASGMCALVAFVGSCHCCALWSTRSSRLILALEIPRYVHAFVPWLQPVSRCTYSN